MRFKADIMKYMDYQIEYGGWKQIETNIINEDAPF